MNKKKIGNFLRTLREEKKLTQIQLSKEFDYNYTDATISKWERGVSVPNIEDLKTLAKFYNVSIDEILNGTRYEEVDFKEKYFIYNNDWWSRYNPHDLYHIREEQELLIETRFKELLKKMVSEELALSEDKEFDFIVNNFYEIFLPAVECKDEDAYRNSMLSASASIDEINNSPYNCLPGGLSDIKFEISKQSASMHKSSNEEKFWEANKKFIFIRRQNIRTDISNVIDDDENAVRDRISKIEDYEKDILLATLQTKNVKNTYGEVGVYEKHYNRKYDEEQLTKRGIRLLIECGAKLNKNLLGYYRIITLEHSIIDELENIQKMYKTPICIQVYVNEKYQYFTVNNTENNRVKLGKKYENETFNENDYLELEKRLYAGERTLLVPYKKRVCGESEQEIFIYARRRIMGMSLQSYIESRDDKMTKELLTNLDNLPLAEIREKYFPSECEGEYIDDAQHMSPEELKKKYYIKEVSNE